MSWWLEIVTKKPSCIYYFGPFDSLKEAELEKGGYIEDLRQEQAEVIDTRIKFDNPLQLTIDLDEPGREREIKVPA
ncbi:DUF1816 domain-containing protein [Aerosakkonemataceae cyanobacterium BLCC-F154]|uniref:DUF1816 domain-containing protein n=1 Tax=Floridaenema fluviatile BLCC-F154 TaxID=3153640 RepID=A0ABV4YIA1_9CYAN